MEKIGEVRSALASGQYGELQGILATCPRRATRRLVSYIIAAVHQESCEYPRIGFQKVESESVHYPPVEGRLIRAAQTNQVVLGIYENNVTFHPLVTLHKWHGMFHEAARRYSEQTLGLVAYATTGKRSISLSSLAQSRACPAQERFYILPTPLLKNPKAYRFPAWSTYNTTYHSNVQMYQHAQTVARLLEETEPTSARIRRLPKLWIKTYQSMYGASYMIPLTNIFIRILQERFNR